jgi:flagellar hook-associated protein 2
LKLNEEKFNQVLAQKPEHVRMFFAGDGYKTGLIASVKREIASITNVTSGTLSNRKKSLQDNISRIDQNIANKERNLGRREEQLRRQFSKLEETMGRLKQQGAAVSAIQGINLGGASGQGGG